MGFHFRGWFGAWMARVRSSTVSCGSPELLNGAARFLRARRVVLAFYRQGRRGGRAGGEFAGEDGAGGGAQLGEDGDSARGSAMATAWRAGARGEVGSCQGRPGSSKPGAREQFGAGA